MSSATIGCNICIKTAIFSKCVISAQQWTSPLPGVCMNNDGRKLKCKAIGHQEKRGKNKQMISNIDNISTKSKLTQDLCNITLTFHTFLSPDFLGFWILNVLKRMHYYFLKTYQSITVIQFPRI